jgi:diacylglycerol kinase family enzyme
VDVVAVFGGDGTTMQAAAALVGTEVSLGVIPGGTGNLLAGNLRIPSAPVRAARALVTATPRLFDLGRMERADGPHFFAVACGAGYDARVMAETASEQKRRWGMGAYVATTLRLMGELRSTPQIEGVDGYVRYARGREIRVETDPVQPVQLDGEAGGETPFTVTVVPRAIRILVPGGKGRFGSEAGTD